MFVNSSKIYLLRELLGLCRDALLVRRVNLSEVQTFVSTFLKLSLQSLCLISRSSDMMDVVEETLLMLLFELKPKMSLLLLRFESAVVCVHLLLGPRDHTIQGEMRVAARNVCCCDGEA